jgi:hypothetical protein
MAKVRVQARSTEDDGLDEAENGSAGSAPRKPKYTGALDVLSKVWQSEGFLGWYQVGKPFSSHRSPANVQILGHGGTNSESGPVAGIAIHV